MVDWRLYDDLLVFFKKHVDNHSYALDDARHERQPFVFYVPLVMVENPLSDSALVLGRRDGVAQNRSVGYLLCYRILNKMRSLPVHVGYPQRQQVGIAVSFVQGIPF